MEIQKLTFKCCGFNPALIRQVALLKNMEKLIS